ncbi:iron chelate uptake ABC transporter family permease subunit [Clostridium chromiireducens]|uniref:iron chelate uptake ABC transporter family permease subunit n=1 Tax=Clostridium chromiireducens TaxID=225345 RepID=UPI003AF4EDB5
MGGLSSVSLKDLLIILFPFLLGGIPLMLIRWKLNVLFLGEEEAQGMGIDTSKIRILTIFCSTLLTAAAVSIGILTSIIGAPFFLYLLFKERRDKE